MIKSLPYYYRKSQLVEDVYKVMQQALNELKNDINTVDLHMFITSTDEFERYEKDVGLTPIISDNETKRSRVIAQLQGSHLLTIAELRNLISLYDKTGCTITEDFKNYTVTILFDGRTGKPYNLEQIQAVIEEVKPAHIKIEYEFLKNTWGDVRRKLGTWGNAKSRTWGDVQDYDGRTWLYVGGDNVYLRDDGANAYVVLVDGVPYARML